MDFSLTEGIFTSCGRGRNLEFLFNENKNIQRVKSFHCINKSKSGKKLWRNQGSRWQNFEDSLVHKANCYEIFTMAPPRIFRFYSDPYEGQIPGSTCGTYYSFLRQNFIEHKTILLSNTPKDEVRAGPQSRQEGLDQYVSQSRIWILTFVRSRQG